MWLPRSLGSDGGTWDVTRHTTHRQWTQPAASLLRAETPVCYEQQCSRAHSALCVLTQTEWFDYGKQRLCVFSFSHSSAPKNQISVSFGLCYITNVWFLKIILGVAALGVIKNCEADFGLEFPTVSRIGLNRLLLVLCYVFVWSSSLSVGDH